MSENARQRVVELFMGLPETTSEGDQHVGFLVRGRRFAWLLDDHHGDGRLTLACKAAPGENTRLTEADPERFFIPSYVGPRGWAGVYLDVSAPPWHELERLAVEAYRLTAPKSLVRLL